MTLEEKRKFRLKPATRYPADPRAVFIMGLAVVSGIPLLFAHVAPESVERLLPVWGVVLWGIALVFGSAITLAGMSRQTVNGIITEQVGSVMVGVAAIIYGACAMLVGGADAILGSMIIIGFGLSCLWRWGQLQSLLSEQQQVVDAVRDIESGS